MIFNINNNKYVIYVPEDKKGYLYLVNKGTGKVDFRLLYSQADTLFGENLKDIGDKEIGLEKKKDVLEPVNVQNRAESVVAIWSNFKKRIMTPGALTDLERKNGIQENPNAGSAMNKLYDTIVSIQRKVASITAYSKKWFGETGDQKDSNANYKLTQDILESMRLFTSFYTIGKRQYGAKDNPYKFVNNKMDFGENTKKLKNLISKIKAASGAEFKKGLDIMDGLHYYVGSDDGGSLMRIVYTDGGERTIPPKGRNIEKGLPPAAAAKPAAAGAAASAAKAATAGAGAAKAAPTAGAAKAAKAAAAPAAAAKAAPAAAAAPLGSRNNPFPSYEEFLKFHNLTNRNKKKRANKSYFFKSKNPAGVYGYEYDEKGKYKKTFGTKGAAYPGSWKESIKQKREKLLNEAIFKKLVK